MLFVLTGQVQTGKTRWLEGLVREIIARSAGFFHRQTELPEGLEVIVKALSLGGNAVSLKLGYHLGYGYRMLLIAAAQQIVLEQQQFQLLVG